MTPRAIVRRQGTVDPVVSIRVGGDHVRYEWHVVVLPSFGVRVALCTPDVRFREGAVMAFN